MKNAKMIKTANVLDTLAKIAGGIASAMVWVLAIFAVLVAVLGEKMFAPGGMSLELDFIKVHLTQEAQIITPMMRAYVAVILLTGAALAYALRILIGLIRGILAPMKEGRPFESGVCVSLRRIAYWVFIVGGISQVFGVIARMLMTRAFPIEAVFSGDAVTGIEYTFGVDLSFVLAGFVVLFLSYVFSYGQALQREADETL